MKNILVVDNYDSFTYNLVHYLESDDDVAVRVIRNDAEYLPEISELDGIVLSPGPGLPKESGRLEEIVSKYIDKVPMLGICLGMQAIIEYYGGKLTNMETVLHGRQTEVQLETSIDTITAGLTNRIQVGRYHSSACMSNELPELLISLGRDEIGYCMLLKNNSMNVYGIQFHPESVLTPDGKRIIQNWTKTL